MSGTFIGRIGWPPVLVAGTADCGDHGENQNAGWSGVLLSEEGGKRCPTGAGGMVQ